MRRLTLLLVPILVASACAATKPEATTMAPASTVPLGPAHWEDHRDDGPDLHDVRSFRRAVDATFVVAAGDRLWKLDDTKWVELAGPGEVPGLVAACSSGIGIFAIHEDPTNVWDSQLFQPVQLTRLSDGAWVPVEAPFELVTAIGCTSDSVVLGYLDADPGIEDASYLVDAYQYFRGNGLAIFDGSRWDTVRLDSGLILTIVAGSGDDLWVGAPAGIAHCRSTDCGGFESPLGYSSESVTSIAVAPNGDVWVTVDDGVADFDGSGWREHYMSIEEWPDLQRVTFVDPQRETLQPQPSDLRPVGIAAAPDGSVWVVTEGGALLRHDGSDWTLQSPEMGMHRASHLVAAAADGSVWLALSDVGAYRFVPGTGHNPSGGPSEFIIPNVEAEEGS